MKRSLFGTLFLGITFFIAGRAHAAIIDFSSLSGIVGNANTSNSNTGSSIYNTWQTTLSGFPGTTTVNGGDTINATITLDQSLTLPSSGSNPGSYTILSLYLTSSTVFDLDLDTDTNPDFNATVSFYNNGFLLETLGAAETTTSSQIVPSILFYPPGNTPITFDELVFSGYDTLITGDGSSLPLDSGFLYYGTNTANAPTPEPPAILLFGIGLLLLLGRMAILKRAPKLA